MTQEWEPDPGSGCENFGSAGWGRRVSTLIGPQEVKEATSIIEIPRIRGGEVWFRNCRVRNTGPDELSVPVGIGSCDAYLDLAPGEEATIRVVDGDGDGERIEADREAPMLHTVQSEDSGAPVEGETGS